MHANETCVNRIKIRTDYFHIAYNWIVSHRIKLYCIQRHSLQWRHNERRGVSNNRYLDSLVSHLFRRKSKKTSKLRVSCLRAINMSRLKAVEWSLLCVAYSYQFLYLDYNFAESYSQESYRTCKCWKGPASEMWSKYVYVVPLLTGGYTSHMAIFTCNR